LLQQGLVQPDNFTGSWAGAFGLTQFMPATFVAHMASASGSGAVDIVGSTADALATTARYIASLGWSDGLRWAVEVAPPQGAARELIAAGSEHACLSGGTTGKCRSVEQWAALGVRALDAATALPPGTRAALLAPSGPDGPAWLVTRNYRAIWQYNRADAYALAIGLLSDALRGDAPMRSPWPTDDAGLSRAEVAAVQRELIRRGHGDVVADGYDGPRTRTAIKAEEALRGWQPTGRAGARIARALAESPAAPEVALPPQPAASDAAPPQRTE
jgi:Transglycosylase SLT domain/Putative peptidoglycan binding domain